jgi:hypothetical protein
VAPEEKLHSQYMLLTSTLVGVRLTIPCTHPQCLLMFLVPSAHNEHKHRTDARFQKAEEEALSIEPAGVRLGQRTMSFEYTPLPVGASCRTHEANSPNSHDAKCDSFDWPALRHQNCWIAADNEAKIEDGGRERVPIALAKL